MRRGANFAAYRDAVFNERVTANFRKVKRPKPSKFIGSLGRLLAKNQGLESRDKKDIIMSLIK